VLSIEHVIHYGLIRRRHSNFFYVERLTQDQLAPDTMAGEVACMLKATLKKAGLEPKVGDRVLLDSFNPTDQSARIIKVLPRHTQLDRPAVANVSVVLLVVAATSPELTWRQITRQLASMALHEVRPLVVVSKMDLLATCADQEQAYVTGVLAYLRDALQLEVYTVGAQTGTADDTAALDDRLQGQVAVLAGESGVGKSSLLNRLDPTLALKIGDISNRLSRGRHTTRHVALIPVKGGAYWVADTPGFSRLDFAGVAPEVLLDKAFPDLSPAVLGCQFSSCLHAPNTEGCALAHLSTKQQPEELPLAQRIWIERVTDFRSLCAEGKTLPEWEREQRTTKGRQGMKALHSRKEDTSHIPEDTAVGNAVRSRVKIDARLREVSRRRVQQSLLLSALSEESIPEDEDALMVDDFSDILDTQVDD
jgi:ribosome biogenesis GTPase / thiamine phosphate phosphatase